MNIRKTLVHGCILICLIPMMTACSSEDFNIGDKFIDSSIRTIITDTCSVRMSTVSIDSVITSGQNSMLAGSFSDTTFGRTKCISYVAFGVPGTIDLPEADIIFDSIDLVLGMNGVWLGDTTLFHTFNIYPLDNVIGLPDDEVYYNTYSVPYSADPIAYFTIRPRPLTKNSITVRLPDALGSDLLGKITEDDDDVLGSQERFMNYLKGFAITSGKDNNCVVGFNLNDSTTVIRLHYHYSEFQRVEGIITITPFQERCFYGANTMRGGTSFSDLYGHELPSAATGHMAMVQALTASYVKIEFPYLNNLLELGDFVTVTDGSLMIYPVRGTYSAAIPLPAELSLYVSNEDDVTLGGVATYTGDALQTGNLVKDDLFDIDTYYTYDITSFLLEQLGAIGINKRNLQLIVPQSNLAVTLQTLIAGDSFHPESNVKLKITYLIYDGK